MVQLREEDDRTEEVAASKGSRDGTSHYMQSASTQSPRILHKDQRSSVTTYSCVLSANSRVSKTDRQTFDILFPGLAVALALPRDKIWTQAPIPWFLLLLIIHFTQFHLAHKKLVTLLYHPFTLNPETTKQPWLLNSVLLCRLGERTVSPPRTLQNIHPLPPHFQVKLL
jgi:hypothetical protein